MFFLSSLNTEWRGKEFYLIINHLQEKYKQIFKSEKCIIYKGEKKL